MDILKQIIILAILLVFISGCSKVQNSPIVPTINTTQKISGAQELMLDMQDLKELGLTDDINEQDLLQLGINGNETNCRTEEDYSNIVDSTLGQYSICLYNIDMLDDTQVVIELQKFTDLDTLNGTYQYQSLHLFSIEGLISENDFGDQSRFRVNNVNDYGGQFNDPNMYYYHLWICKDKYLIHITSKGSREDAKEYISRIGKLILRKFD